MQLRCRTLIAVQRICRWIAAFLVTGVKREIAQYSPLVGVPGTPKQNRISQLRTNWRFVVLKAGACRRTCNNMWH